MSDWQEGDLALAINIDGWFDDMGVDDGPQWPCDGPAPGSICKVTKVLPFEPLALQLEGWGDGPLDTWEADCFRKITPPPADEFDHETIKLLNSKPAREMA